MSEPVLLVVIFLFLLPLWLRLRKDFVSGLSYAIVLLVTMTPLLRIRMPGAFPELTIDRLVLLSLLFSWFRHPDRRSPLRTVALARPILIWASLAFVSLVGTIDYVASIKRYLDYVVDFFLIYFMMATTLRTREDALRILRSACLGLAIVAALAFVEKYTGFNVVDRLLPHTDPQFAPTRDIRVTYRHRILLGTGMAMGWPLALYFAQTATSLIRRRMAWVALIAMLSACYFARSRGPWLASALAGGVLIAFSSGAIRKRIVRIGLLAALLLVARPGVFDTISGLGEATMDASSFKGGTFRYRLELWSLATAEVSKTPWRILFGYGPGAGSNRSLEWHVSYRDRDEAIWSWDNDLAYSLYQYGFLGLIATVILYTSIPWLFLSYARRLTGSERELFACLGASAVVLFFMMSNVLIYARQLYYLLWAVTAVGFALRAQTKLAHVEQEELSYSVHMDEGYASGVQQMGQTATDGR